jgi:hypothetical protein
VRPAELLRRYVKEHNAVVREGSSKNLKGVLDADAEMSFEGVAVGPFAGRDAIAAAIHARPPSDELTIGRIIEDDQRAIAPYAWKNDQIPGGELVVFRGKTGIAKLVVRVHAAQTG